MGRNIRIRLQLLPAPPRDWTGVRKAPRGGRRPRGDRGHWPGAGYRKDGPGAGRQALACVCDVASPPVGRGAMAAEVEKTFGRCDILINSAGIYPIKPFEEMTFADWRHVLFDQSRFAFLHRIGALSRE